MAELDDGDTYSPTRYWLNLSQEERFESISKILQQDAIGAGISIKEAMDNGHVVLRIEHPIPAGERGIFLLDLEQKCKMNIDIGITLWLEPVGDKSKLRQLRGVEVKS